MYEVQVLGSAATPVVVTTERIRWAVRCVLSSAKSKCRRLSTAKHHASDWSHKVSSPHVLRTALALLADQVRLLGWYYGVLSNDPVDERRSGSPITTANDRIPR